MVVESPPQVQTEEAAENQRKFDWHRFLHISSWVVLIVFAPITVLILLSQNSLPGDTFYPVKRGMEGVVLIAASLNPTTRAIFHTDLADRRFDEAQKMILARADASSLTDFVDEVKVAQQQINVVNDQKEKAGLQQQLDDKIEHYVSQLQQTKQQVIAQAAPQTIASQPVGPTPVESGQPSPTPFLIASKPMVTTQLSQPTAIKSEPTNTPVPIPTSQPGQPSLPTNTPVPLLTQNPAEPTLTLIPTAIQIRPTVTPETSNPARIPTITQVYELTPTPVQTVGVRPTITSIVLQPTPTIIIPSPTPMLTSPVVNIIGGIDNASTQLCQLRPTACHATGTNNTQLNQNSQSVGTQSTENRSSSQQERRHEGSVSPTQPVVNQSVNTPIPNRSSIRIQSSSGTQTNQNNSSQRTSNRD